ncbi:hypothetical protein BSZ07_00625 [Streptomyces sp. M1013]|uniref:hypothetical protein n=1 Tax=Streptomyces sp. M1013 TaxID=549798 RepID=UPI000978EEDB|nr:hypothetical protein [Streptomyces sp. M1013]OMI91426.1 hypothetical protein BSZ07_00625 [Streptomyces sp. M1013]
MTTHALVLKTFPAGSPRGSWPTEEFAARLREHGRGAEVVMDLVEDSFLVVEAAPPLAPQDTSGHEVSRLGSVA